MTTTKSRTRSAAVSELPVVWTLVEVVVVVEILVETAVTVVVRAGDGRMLIAKSAATTATAAIATEAATVHLFMPRK